MRGGSDRSRSRPRSILIGVGVGIFAIFGGVLWFAYVDVMGLGSGPPPLIRADAGPIKRAPDEPGGMQLPNRDSAAARILEEQAEPVRRERILPRQDSAAPEPKPPPETEPAMAPSGPSTPVPDTAFAAVPPPTPAPDTQRGNSADADAEVRPAAAPRDLLPLPIPSEPSAAPVKVAENALSPPLETLAAREPTPELLARGAASKSVAVTPPAAPSRSSADATGQSTPLPIVAREPQAESPRVAPSTPPRPLAGTVTSTTLAPTQMAARQPEQPAAARPGPSVTPVFRVQLGAFRTDVAAGQAWNDLQRRNRQALGELRASVLQAETSSGTFYRLQAGPLPSRDVAVQACAQVKQGGNDCFIVGPLP